MIMCFWILQFRLRTGIIVLTSYQTSEEAWFAADITD